MSSIQWGIIDLGNIEHKFADGLMEKLLGQRHKARNSRNDLVIIAKGAN